MTTESRNRPLFWILAVVLGVAAGYIHLLEPDPTMAALLVVAFTMALGVSQPRKPWRWALIIALCLPAAELLAFLGRTKPTRAAVYASFVTLVPAFVGAYGGALMRQMVGNVFAKIASPQSTERKSKIDD
jgi:hypothetical protein